MVAAIHGLLKALSASGITIKAHGDNLRYEPATAMTPDLLLAVKRCKGELLELLSAADCKSKADIEFDRFERVAKPMPGGIGWYCPIYGTPEMPRGITAQQWSDVAVAAEALRVRRQGLRASRVTRKRATITNVGTLFGKRAKT